MARVNIDVGAILGKVQEHLKNAGIDIDVASTVDARCGENGDAM